MTFEALLKSRLEQAGAEVRTFQEAGVGFLYGILVRTRGSAATVRLTKGSGTGDPVATEAEQAAHAVNVARLDAVKGAPSATHGVDGARPVEDLMRDVLAADLPPTAVEVEGPADGRTKPGVKIRFRSGSEIYMTPVDIRR
ncbi:hypothetical protein Dfulv_17075 [Dactylosporangium fulvum]|uniref:TldD/PmbA family protein n=1 Tax=Dactylosporangium fulvum TaxID=53359 RepID=A0ABY5W927_9ACTN|nr:hypothetical protein [Dactylosporangium fulvum]UWP85860.1 hypothetical protein Dfulv_17075 [Dactylosporangium fulvum]